MFQRRSDRQPLTVARLGNGPSYTFRVSLIHSLVRKGAIVVDQVKRIAGKGRPKLSANPQDLLESAAEMKSSLRSAKYIKNTFGEAADQVKNPADEWGSKSEKQERSGEEPDKKEPNN